MINHRMSRTFRPEYIKVQMIGNGAWSERVAKALKDKLDALVDRSLTTPVNGYARDAHVLIMEKLVDPDFVFLKNLREKWSERELPVIVVDDNDSSEMAAMCAGANAFIDRSLHYDTRHLEKLVYGLACEGTC